MLTYNGTQFEEMDTEAVLRRKPAVAVVDEFAHTNVPGAGRDKRWQDVRALLDAGIDVLTTMNVQHLESLNDQVWRVTGVRVRETVPDWVVDEAEEVVFVDLTPQRPAQPHRARRGLRAGKSAPRHGQFLHRDEPHGAARNRHAPCRARSGRQAARRRQAMRAAPRAAHERILICLTGSPSSAILIRRGKRVADYLQADCIAVHVSGGPTSASGRPWSGT